MKQKFILLIVAMCATMFTACSKDDDGDGESGVLTMVVDGGYDLEPDLIFSKKTKITVEFGDGTVKDYVTIYEKDEESGEEVYYVGIDYKYSKEKRYTVQISGCQALEEFWCEQSLISLDVSECTALKELWCGGNQLTSLDVSDCKSLTFLRCNGNNLTSLDVSKNKALTGLVCDGNNFSEKAMNTIYNGLPVVSEGKLRCDKIGDYSIAENKGWEVTDYD